MSKLDWGRHKRRRDLSSEGYAQRAADRLLNPPKSRVAFNGDRQPYRQRKHTESREVCITVGADCPWNSTPGVRQAHQFPSVQAARAAGFGDVD